MDIQFFLPDTGAWRTNTTRVKSVGGKILKRLSFICEDGHVMELILNNDRPVEKIRCIEIIPDRLMSCGKPVEVFWPGGEAPSWHFKL